MATKTKTKPKAECERCGNPFSVEEAESPRLDDDDDPICDDCYHERYEFTCCCCQEYGEVKDQHNLLVVFKEISKVLPGVYKVVDRPYVTHAMIGEGWLHPGSLKRIADVNPDMDGNGYPCGHLCLECQGHVMAQFAAKCSMCLNKSLSCLCVQFGSWKNFKASKYQWTKAKIACASCRHSHKGAWKLDEKQ